MCVRKAFAWWLSTKVRTGLKALVLWANMAALLVVAQVTPHRMKVQVVLPWVDMVVVNMAVLRRVRRKVVPVARPRVKVFHLKVKATVVVMMVRPRVVNIKAPLRMKVVVLPPQVVVATNSEKEKAGVFPGLFILTIYFAVCVEECLRGEPADPRGESVSPRSKATQRRPYPCLP